jgi:hypothetical protein
MATLQNDKPQLSSAASQWTAFDPVSHGQDKAAAGVKMLFDALSLWFRLFNCASNGVPICRKITISTGGTG